MGHLSRSCPDNPKGLYAEGECSDLLQIKHIFPTYVTQNQETFWIKKSNFQMSFILGEHRSDGQNSSLVFTIWRFLFQF